MYKIKSNLIVAIEVFLVHVFVIAFVSFICSIISRNKMFSMLLPLILLQIASVIAFALCTDCYLAVILSILLLPIHPFFKGILSLATDHMSLLWCHPHLVHESKVLQEHANSNHPSHLHGINLVIWVCCPQYLTSTSIFLPSCNSCFILHHYLILPVCYAGSIQKHTVCLNWCDIPIHIDVCLFWWGNVPGSCQLKTFKFWKT